MLIKIIQILCVIMLLEVNMILFTYLWRYKSDAFPKKNKNRKKMQNIHTEPVEKEEKKTNVEIRTVKQSVSAGSEVKCRRSESEDAKEYNIIATKSALSGNRRYLGIIDVEKKGCYGTPVVIKEMDEGELIVQKKENDIFYVEPSKAILDEAEYKYSALINCFDLTQNIAPGDKYRVVEILKQAKLKKTGDEYLLEEKGILRIEKGK